MLLWSLKEKEKISLNGTKLWKTTLKLFLRIGLRLCLKRENLPPDDYYLNKYIELLQVIDNNKANEC